MLKYVIIVSMGLFVFSSCATHKKKKQQDAIEEVAQKEEVVQEVIKENVSETMQVNNEWTEGVIRLSSVETECPVVIELTSSNRVFYPVGLADKYKEDGLKIKFTYLLSRAPLPEKCFGKIAVIVDSVE
jgi:predicted xylose isomerase-like sugar epimerase